MKATYWQRSESLDYVNKTDKVIEANSIVDLKTRIAVTGTSINPNETGSIHVTGVYRIKKKREKRSLLRQMFISMIRMALPQQRMVTRLPVVLRRMLPRKQNIFW